MTIQIPNNIIQQAGFTELDLRLEIAILLFQKEVFTLAQASRFAGMHRALFQKELGKREIEVHYDGEMLDNDMKTLNSLFGDRSQ
ncbi:MAG: UPF0175 family protein [Bacteroidia bacterium]